MAKRRVAEAIIVLLLLPVGLVIADHQAWTFGSTHDGIDPEMCVGPTLGASDPEMFEGDRSTGASDPLMLTTSIDFVEGKTTVSRLVDWLKEKQITILKNMPGRRTPLGPWLDR
ncbi:MAG TPA: hypothetical protein VGQ12_17655 [Candidatus Angelobacter sp.]|nr:hypothetical protein [Candidatus Angelobacter sp.]